MVITEAITIINNVWGKQAITIVNDVWGKQAITIINNVWGNRRLLSLTMYGDNGGDLYL